MENTNISKVKTVLTTIIIEIISILIIIAMAILSEDFTLGSWINAIIIIVLLSVANIILWPIFTRI